ncbi:MAG: tRNA (adenosine(37)-N6)-threonylcarbamoyltransferase complex dimerization subunit type 1 TsaB [Lachnospiraceae bacterium]|nr:tRNA (adenosine(37)-N6)-threonylcarbamoyltransferase complex dimerization subunit type 1 TsaB [Lachnospiraceae bacterium]
MKLLALDSSGLVASVAVVEDDTLLAEFTMNYKKTHSQTLVPMMNEVKRMIDLDLESIDAIAIAAGPGSFTGLRIGSATAKGLGLALDKPIVPVPTVDALAYNMRGTADVVCPLMDARREQVYTGLYDFSYQDGSYRMNIIKSQCAVALQEIAAACNELGRRVIFLGDGVPVYREKISQCVNVPYSFADSFQNRQRASVVAALGMSLFRQGVVVSAQDHAPEYLRLSQAERERMEQ